MTRPPSVRGIALFLLLVLLGAAVGLAGGLVLGAWPPAGLLLALVATAACFLGARIALRGPLGVGAAGLGWLAVLVVFLTPRPEGDNLYAPATGTYVFMVGGILAAVMCATLQGPVGRPDPANGAGR